MFLRGNRVRTLRSSSHPMPYRPGTEGRLRGFRPRDPLLRPANRGRIRRPAHPGMRRYEHHLHLRRLHDRRCMPSTGARRCPRRELSSNPLRATEQHQGQRVVLSASIATGSHRWVRFDPFRTACGCALTQPKPGPARLAKPCLDSPKTAERDEQPPATKRSGRYLEEVGPNALREDLRGS